MLRASSSIPPLSQKTMTPIATLVWLDQSVSRRSLDWAGDLKFLGGVRDNTTPTAPRRNIFTVILTCASMGARADVSSARGATGS